MSCHPLSISTLSPVHVGCDEVYEPSNFVIADGLLHSLDAADLAAALSDSERRQLAALADGREPIGALQRFFRERAGRFAGFARHQVAVAEAIAREYEEKAGKPTQRGPSGEATYNLFPIARTAFRSMDNTPYLPGSSLKGSMRTAWLNRVNEGRPLTADEKRDRRNASRHLQERLLGYRAGQFESDPFRHVALADAHPEDDDSPPPTCVLYAIGKKKRVPREGERPPQELPVFLEAVPDALPAAFLGELRLNDQHGRIRWNALCDACNDFYRPQIEAELDHPVLGSQLEADWKRSIERLLGSELGELIAARQGFLLRVGRHSGAESVTLDGPADDPIRDIKILGPRLPRDRIKERQEKGRKWREVDFESVAALAPSLDTKNVVQRHDGRFVAEDVLKREGVFFDRGGQVHFFRPHTTEKRFASPTRAGTGALLPFGWIWVDACDDAHRHLSDSLHRQLAERSRPLREDHRDRLSRLEAAQQARAAAAAEAEVLRRQAEADARAEAQAEAARQAARAAMSPNRRAVEQFADDCRDRAGQAHSRKDPPNPGQGLYGQALRLAAQAVAGGDWSAEEKAALADAIETWLPRIVERLDRKDDWKDARKKLRLAALRGQ